MIHMHLYVSHTPLSVEMNTAVSQNANQVLPMLCERLSSYPFIVSFVIFFI